MYNVSSFDKTLKIKKQIDWDDRITKKSKLMKWVDFDILSLTNMFDWSWLWIKYKLQAMDSTRIDFFSWAIKSNYKKTSENKNDWLSREIASYMYNWNKIVI